MSAARSGGKATPELVHTVLAARRFYLDGMSKSDIADELGLSRFKVSRLLDAARRDGIVRIEIDVPAEVDVDLSSALMSAYGIRQALVIKVVDPSEGFLRLQLGRACAELLGDALDASDVLGVSWGRTLHAMVGALPSLPACTVVQIVGGIAAPDLNVNSLELVRRVAEQAGGPVYPLHVPMVLDSPQTAATLREESQVRRTFAQFGKLTKAVVGIGAWRPGASALESALPDRVADKLKAAGAVADICTTVLAADGSPVAVDDLRARSIAIDTEQLARVPEVIAIAGGAAKADAIAAALRSGLVHRLITDQNAAEALIALTRV